MRSHPDTMTSRCGHANALHAHEFSTHFGARVAKLVAKQKQFAERRLTVGTQCAEQRSHTDRGNAIGGEIQVLQR